MSLYVNPPTPAHEAAPIPGVPPKDKERGPAKGIPAKVLEQVEREMDREREKEREERERRKKFNF